MIYSREKNAKGEVTQLLKGWAAGDAAALEELFPMVLDELRVIARAALAREGRHHSLQPTELIAEVCLKLIGQKVLYWETRSQFYAFSSTLMRRILVDHARHRQAAKRSAIKVPLDEAPDVEEEKSPYVLAVGDALKSLEAVSPRQARIVEMRIFGGWTVEEVAEALGMSTITVKRDWKSALLWMRRELSRNVERPTSISLRLERPHGIDARPPSRVLV